MVEIEFPKIERTEGDEREARFVIEPLPAGYGTTLGNSLRRVLLSSLSGAAITSVRIRGVAHEFSTIPGLNEDVVQLVLNLKRVRLKSFATEPVTLTLEKDGPGEVTAGDIVTTSDVEIVNPQERIATLEPEASLWMELTVETGKGFHPAERREGLPIGVIPIDALFSPVRLVNFNIENTRHEFTFAGDLAMPEPMAQNIAGSVVGETRLNIGEHAFDVSYGRLILIALDRLRRSNIYPDRTQLDSAILAGSAWIARQIGQLQNCIGTHVSRQGVRRGCRLTEGSRPRFAWEERTRLRGALRAPLTGRPAFSRLACR